MPQQKKAKVPARTKQQKARSLRVRAKVNAKAAGRANKAGQVGISRSFQREAARLNKESRKMLKGG